MRITSVYLLLGGQLLLLDELSRCLTLAFSVPPVMRRREESSFGVVLRRSAASPGNDQDNEEDTNRNHLLQENDDDDDVLPPPNNTSEDAFNGSAPLRPLGGGTAMIFEMARKYLIDFEKEVNDAAAIQDEQQRTTAAHSTQTSAAETERGGGGGVKQPPPRRRKVLPRWHPHNGISDLNPRFRTQAPVMNNVGYAKSIWRNVRKRDKPSLWRNALRTYDRMIVLEQQHQQESSSTKSSGTSLNIYRSAIHHEGAMLACAKLGLWQRALEIYHSVYEQELEQQQDDSQTKKLQQQQQSLSLTSPTSSTVSRSSTPERSNRVRKRSRVRVTDNMVVSLVRACCRASRLTSSSSSSPSSRTPSFRRIPLDTAREVLEQLYERHNIPMASYFVNPLAAAYQNLGYSEEAADLIETMLGDRVAGDEPENGVDILNVFDLSSKDKGSYSLLVESAVSSGDWAGAVEALSNMTEAGLYPNQRHVNTWTEVSERKRRPRAAGSWKKKRNDYWLESVR